MVDQRRIVVVGGGISGLATGYHLGRGGCQVTVLEAADVAGGRIATEPVAGVEVDTGPDALLMRSPAASALVAELGLEPLLRPPAAGGAYVWSGGRLRPLPPGSVFGVPQRLLPLLRSGLLGPAGFVRAGADLVLPRLPAAATADPTIEELLRPRFGRQVYERIVEPMLGGVHAGRAGHLSARSAVPEVAALAVRHRSLYLGLRGLDAARRGAPPAPAPLMTLEGGLAVLVHAVRQGILTAGGQVLTAARAGAVSVGGGGAGYRIVGDGFDPIEADDVVLATPAPEAARLLRPVAPVASDALAGIRYAGVATVVLAYRAGEAVLPPGTGFLVPPVEGRLLVGCTWTTAKWPHLVTAAAARSGTAAPVLVRAMVGRDGDQAWAALDDDDLVRAVRAELAAATGVRAEPVVVRVRRLPAAMPQYTVGHARRLDAVRDGLAALPGVHLTGAGYRGVGIAACLHQAQQVAAQILSRPTPALRDAS
ncbi:MAG TPA: protoporphyrinogen oxidase [Kineosporiaceae bacterium]